MRESRRLVVWAASLALCLVFPVLLRAASPDELKRHAFETIDRNADRIALLGDSLFYFGELGMQEFESTKLIKETLEGMPTALWARWGTGKPLILIATEVDALPEGSQTPGIIDRKPLVDGDDTKETKYFSLLPPDATPPLELNREMMEKFRPEMRKFYLNKPVQFR